MDWVAGVVVFVSLALLAVDASRRWGHPRAYIDPRSPLTWAVGSVLVAAAVLVAVID